MRQAYRLIVVGGGHAGVEAAWAAANLLQDPGSVALVTLDPAKIGEMSCNPAIGGLAKGQLVREIDALGGLMGLVADATGIHFKVLNQSKGPAVRGPRCQSDKVAYARTVREMIASRPEIEVISAAVEDLIIEDGTCVGCVVSPRVFDDLGPDRGATPRLAERVELRAGATILTTGTFMRGLMHTGEAKTPGGRAGEAPALGISATLSRLGFELGRLKTGTPPRLKKSSIRWDDLEPQHGDDEPTPFSDLTLATEPFGTPAANLATAFPTLAQVECRQTQTSPEAHAAVRENLHRAPMYSGEIDAAGPRYCPAFEDKVVRFPDRLTHGVFLEPESLETDWVYCNGISSSLPADVQDIIVRTMPGCEDAHIYRHGYAVEYDMVRPHQIHATGMTKAYPGLFLAGQINGTSGYEEAAAQGLVAGLNAVRFTRRETEIVFGRDEAYIGVLMDDLVTKTPREPYRMFTSRAEHRLLLRADNAADRLTPRAAELGLLSGETGAARRRVFDRRREHLAHVHKSIDAARVGDTPMRDALRRTDFELEDLIKALPELAPKDHVTRRALFTAFADRKYEPYVERERININRQREMEEKRLPRSIDYTMLTKLRPEARHALDRFRPSTFGQASRLEGITPADLTLLAVLLRQHAEQRIGA